MSDTRNATRQRRKFFNELMRPYRLIAARTPDVNARAAILGLINMLESASEMMDFSPPEPGEMEFLQEVTEALKDNDEARIDALARRARERPKGEP